MPSFGHELKEKMGFCKNLVRKYGGEVIAMPLDSSRIVDFLGLIWFPHRALCSTTSTAGYDTKSSLGAWDTLHLEIRNMLSRNHSARCILRAIFHISTSNGAIVTSCFYASSTLQRCLFDLRCPSFFGLRLGKYRSMHRPRPCRCTWLLSGWSIYKLAWLDFDDSCIDYQHNNREQTSLSMCTYRA
jgi:hypothetical protein